jgi:hypothetical protein
MRPGRLRKRKRSGMGIGCKLTPAPNRNNSLSPSKRGEGWGEGFVLVNIGCLTPALFSLREAREKKWCGCQAAPGFQLNGRRNGRR